MDKPPFKTPASLPPSELASAPHPQRYRWLVRLLSRPRAALFVVALSFACLLFSLDTGLAADDYIHMLIARGSGEIEGFVHSPLDMFRFTGAAATRTLMREGVISWWDDPQVQLAFFRPLSSLTHLLDYRLWPDKPWLMHLHSALWALLLLCGVLAFYRRVLSPPWVVTLATAIYALDDGRAWFVSWIAARNAVVATAFSVWALYFYHRGRVLVHQEALPRTFRFVPWATPSGIAALLLYATALLAGEGSLSLCAYLFAHALFLDRSSVRARVWALAPFAVVTLLWRTAYVALGYGVRGSGLYFDPTRQPLSFLGALAERGPILLFSQIGGFWSDAYTGLYPYPWLMRLIWVAACLTLLLLGYLLVPLWRRDCLFRFGTTGALLSVVPASAVFSADRMLSWVAIGGALAIARAIACYIEAPALLRTGARRFVAPPMILFLVVSNLILDPPFLASRARGNAAMRDIIDRAHTGIPRDPSIRERFVVYLNPPAVPMAAYVPIERAALGVPRPGQQYWLTAGTDAVTVVRVDARTLRVTPARGFVQDHQAWLLRDPVAAFEVGETIRLDGLTIEVERLTADGRPATILARFAQSLNDPRYLWLRWQDGGYVEARLPEKGQRITLPPADYLHMILGDARDLLP